jgi:Ca2+-binding RTX toxin-like protein
VTAFNGTPGDDLFVKPPRSETQVLAEGRDVGFSADGAKIIVAPDAAMGRFLYEPNTFTISAHPVSDIDVSNDIKILFSTTETRSDNDTNNGGEDLYIFKSGSFHLISTDSSGSQLSSSGTFRAQFSTDETGVYFTSNSSGLDATDLNGTTDVFFKDLTSGLVSLISSTNTGVAGDDATEGFVLATDGRHVLLHSKAANFSAADTNGAYDLYVKDVVNGSIERVSIGEGGGQFAGDTDDGDLSSDGSVVVFVNGDGLHIRDVVHGATSRLAIDFAAPAGQSLVIGGVDLSPDGEKVAFHTNASLLDADTNNVSDVYVYDLGTGEIDRVSKSEAGEQFQYESTSPHFLPSEGSASLVYTTVEKNFEGTVYDIPSVSPRTTDTVVVRQDLGPAGGHSGSSTDVFDGLQGDDTVSYAEFWQGVKVSLAASGPRTISIGNSDTLVSIENLEGSAFDDALTGNAEANRLVGGAGIDRLNGGGGADTLEGGADNDTYTIDGAGVVIVETGTGGDNDQVKSSASYTLADNVEKLTLTGSGAIDGTGNGAANNLIGNAAANHLFGLAGADKLDGGAGADTLEGGDDNDTYTVDNVGDVIVETGIGGTADQVKSSVSYALADNVEKLTLTGAAAIDGTGNGAANTIKGADAANLLQGLGGKDNLSGAGGDDTLAGGDGADVLTGGGGHDVFLFDSLTTSADKDSVKDFTVGEDHLAIDRSVFTAFSGDPAGPLSASEFTIGTKATASGQHLIYDPAKGALYYDADGVGGAAQVEIAVLSNKPALGASDFLLA